MGERKGPKSRVRLSKWSPTDQVSIALSPCLGTLNRRYTLAKSFYCILALTKMRLPFCDKRVYTIFCLMNDSYGTTQCVSKHLMPSYLSSLILPVLLCSNRKTATIARFYQSLKCVVERTKFTRQFNFSRRIQFKLFVLNGELFTIFQAHIFIESEFLWLEDIFMIVKKP